jgi:hypothetical protein
MFAAREKFNCGDECVLKSLEVIDGAKIGSKIVEIVHIKDSSIIL